MGARQPRLAATAVAAGLLLAACSGSTGNVDTVAKAESRGWLDEGAWTSKSSGPGASAAAGGSAVLRAASADAVGEGVATAAGAPLSPPLRQQGTGLRAGSTDDNERWDDYLRYRREFAALGIPVHDFDVSERHVFRVRDREGDPVLGARVRITPKGSNDTIAELVTYADGRALFFPLAGKASKSETFEARVSIEGAPEVRVPIGRGSGQHDVKLETGASARTKLDVLFLLDATGSMGDEIDRLKDNMVSVAERIGRLEPKPDVRFGLTAYRDGGDLFVTRTFDFTNNTETFTKALREVKADGGGDTPEALSAGLRAALAKPAWRGDDTVKLVFLVADAAPQLRDPEGADYAVEVMRAASRGIKIHPIASSGLDDQGEFVYRQLAQATTGRFVFLTYGADGGPGDETTHHVDKYAVLSLDSLVVQLVEDELRAGARRQQ